MPAVATAVAGWTGDVETVRPAVGVGHEALTPLSREEIAAVLDDLARLAERAPGVAGDPAFMGAARLALAAVGARPVIVEVERPAQPPPTTPVEADDDAPKLRRDIAEALGDAARLVTRVSDLERGVATARHEAAEAERLTETVQAALRDAETENTRLRASLATTQREAAAQCDAKERTAGELRQEVGELRENLAASNATSGETLARVRSVLDGLRRVEFSAKSTKYTFRNTRKPIPCCPVCHGLTLEGLSAKDKDAGHQQSCWLGTAVAALTTLDR